MGWIGVDLDGTLAFDIPGGPFDPTAIGVPVPAMVRRIKDHIANGDEVRIFTARASVKDHQTVSSGTADEYLATVVGAIKKWCLQHIGVELEVTAEKDYQMYKIYDDRAVQVQRNTGKLIGCMQCDPPWMKN